MPGFQDRTGCPDKVKVPKAIREQFGECFERMGGIDGLYTWAQDNEKSFYSLYAKMAERTLKITETRTHEHFIEIVMNENKRLEVEKGQPIGLIEAVPKKQENITNNT